MTTEPKHILDFLADDKRKPHRIVQQKEARKLAAEGKHLQACFRYLDAAQYWNSKQRKAPALRMAMAAVYERQQAIAEQQLQPEADE